MKRNINFDNEKAYHKTKLLLKIYRDVVWSIEDRVAEIEEEYYEMGSNSLVEALEYLDEYNSNMNRKKLEDELCSVFKSKLLIEIVDKALLKVKKYPDYGDIYFEIIYKQYIQKNKYPEKYIIQVLNFERTTFYKRKKEAIKLMGVALWGYVLPELKGLW
ncbi:hypothetical protein [Tepidibacter hydrothermalis]|uniref:Phage transcriptional regulator, ArpU family n=1 Tax=Tepidibacter hydrothermalis TaxID=3036126 RepID=A0ABY8EGC2_9FIRM|nr:hypothetical protein [Tepidibacter hydrothermalis]WFD10900.1 hypothetical protein P4S50_02170 [Tepidibacter hydrothermalis]